MLKKIFALAAIVMVMGSFAVGQVMANPPAKEAKIEIPDD